MIFEAYCAFSIGGAYHGTGMHHADLEAHEIKTAMRVSIRPGLLLRARFYVTNPRI